MPRSWNWARQTTLSTQIFPVLMTARRDGSGTPSKSLMSVCSHHHALPKNSTIQSRAAGKHLLYCLIWGASVFLEVSKQQGQRNPISEGLWFICTLGKVLRKPRSTDQPATARALERLSAEGQHQGHRSRTTASALPSALGPRSCRAIKAQAGRERSLRTGRSCIQALRGDRSGSTKHSRFPVYRALQLPQEETTTETKVSSIVGALHSVGTEQLCP